MDNQDGILWHSFVFSSSVPSICHCLCYVGLSCLLQTTGVLPASSRCQSVLHQGWSGGIRCTCTVCTCMCVIVCSTCAWKCAQMYVYMYNLCTLCTCIYWYTLIWYLSTCACNTVPYSSLILYYMLSSSSSSSFSPSSRLHVLLFQMVCLRMEEGEEKVVGLHLTGPNAGEMLQGFSVALKWAWLTAGVNKLACMVK